MYLLSLVGSSPTDRTYGQLLEETFRVRGEVLAQAHARGGDGLCRNSFSSLPSPTFDNQMFDENWVLMGSMAGKMERIRC